MVWRHQEPSLAVPKEWQFSKAMVARYLLGGGRIADGAGFLAGLSRPSR